MKNSKIKTVKELPSWFKLENYGKAKSFGATEWYYELMPRFYIMRRGVEKFINDELDAYQRWDLIRQHGLLFHVTRGQKITTVAPQIQLFQKKEEISQRLEYEFSSITSLQNMIV